MGLAPVWSVNKSRRCSAAPIRSLPRTAASLVRRGGSSLTQVKAQCGRHPYFAVMESDLATVRPCASPGQRAGRCGFPVSPACPKGCHDADVERPALHTGPEFDIEAARSRVANIRSLWQETI